jgi:hypothetical protein
MRFARPVDCNALILNVTTLSSLFENSKVKILEGAHGGRKKYFQNLYKGKFLVRSCQDFSVNKIFSSASVNKKHKLMSSKNIARLGQIENNNLEEMETGLVSIVPKPDSYVRPLQRKLAYDRPNMYILLRRLNNRNKSDGKPGLLSVRGQKSLFMFVKCRIHNCSGAVAFCVKDRQQGVGSDVLKKK